MFENSSIELPKLKSLNLGLLLLQKYMRNFSIFTVPRTQTPHLTNLSGDISNGIFFNEIDSVIISVFLLKVEPNFEGFYFRGNGYESSRNVVFLIIKLKKTFFQFVLFQYVFSVFNRRYTIINKILFMC
jgi:hypothetical protein